MERNDNKLLEIRKLKQLQQEITLVFDEIALFRHKHHCYFVQYREYEHLEAALKTRYKALGRTPNQYSALVSVGYNQEANAYHINQRSTLKAAILNLKWGLSC